MKTKLIELSDEQIDSLKSLINVTVESTISDQDYDTGDPDSEGVKYVQELLGIFEALDIENPTVEAMRKEIHALKNRVTGLQFELLLKDER